MKFTPAVFLLFQCNTVGANILGTASLQQWGSAQELAAAPAPAATPTPTLSGVMISFALNNIRYIDMKKKVETSNKLNRTFRSYLGQFVTVEDVFRGAITEAVTEAIRPYLPTASQWSGPPLAPAAASKPAAAPSPAAFLASAPSGSAPKPPASNVFVQFWPGTEGCVACYGDWLIPKVRDLDAVMQSGDVIATMPRTLLVYASKVGDLKATFARSDGFEEGDVVEIRGSGNYETKQITKKGDKNQIYFSEPLLNSYNDGSTIRAVAKAAEWGPNVAKPNGTAPRDHSENIYGKKILRHSNPNWPENQRKNNVLPHWNDIFATTTNVGVTVTGMPGTTLDEVPIIQKALETSKAKGYMQAALSRKIFENAGVMPNIGGFSINITQIEQWDVQACAKNLKKVATRFGKSYTLRNVPGALYNECTNFASVMSFSHDSNPTLRDVQTCRYATARFRAKWNSPKGKKGGLEMSDMVDFCLDVCEKKNGAGAQMCHIVEGDKLLNAPP